MAWILVAVVVTAIGVLALLLAPALFASLVGILIVAAILRRWGLWRTTVSLSLVASVVRSSGFQGTLADAGWYVVQFAPLLVATIWSFREAPPRVRTSDRRVVLMMVLFVVSTALSSLLSAAPQEALTQSALLALVSIFFVVTFLRRWSSSDIIRGDLEMLFVTICALQVVGLIGAFASSWAFDPDYGRYVGLFSNANYAGVVSAMGIAIGIFLLRDSAHRAFIMVGITTLLIAMLMSGSRGALLAVFSGLFVQLLARGSRRIVLTVSTAAIVGALGLVALNRSMVDQVAAFFVRDANADITSGRLKLYAGLIEQFQTSPVLGTGYRTSELAGGLAGHNVYLSVLTETGIVGFTLFAALILSLVVASRHGGAHRPLVGAAVTVAVMEMTESSVFGFGGPTALTAWIIVLAFAASGRFLGRRHSDRLNPRASTSSLVSAA